MEPAKIKTKKIPKTGIYKQTKKIPLLLETAKKPLEVLFFVFNIIFVFALILALYHKAGKWQKRKRDKPVSI